MFLSCQYRKNSVVLLQFLYCFYVQIDLFSFYILFSQYRSCDDTLENCFFQTLSYSCTYQRIIIYEKKKEQIPLSPLLGKQNIQTKEVYCINKKQSAIR